MKKVMMIVLLMCLVGMSYGQDTIVTIKGDTIIATDIKKNNSYGYNYIDVEGNKCSIPENKVSHVIIDGEILKANESSDVELPDVKISEYKNNLNLGGYYIEKGSFIKNNAILLSLLGSGLIALGTFQENGATMIKIGSLVTLISIPINMSGNNKIATGGRLIKNYKVK